MHIPQLIFIAIASVQMAKAVIKRSVVGVLDVLLVLGLLYWGGFFTN